MAEWPSAAPLRIASRTRHRACCGPGAGPTSRAALRAQDWAADPKLQPPFGGEILVGTHGGRGYEHCFNGFLPDGTPAPNSITRELYVTKFLPRMAERWAATAPPGAPLEWRSY